MIKPIMFFQKHSLNIIGIILLLKQKANCYSKDRLSFDKLEIYFIVSNLDFNFFKPLTMNNQNLGLDSQAWLSLLLSLNSSQVYNQIDKLGGFCCKQGNLSCCR